MSFLFRAASRFSRITLKAILPTFSQSFWSEIRNKPQIFKKSSSQAKKWLGRPSLKHPNSANYTLDTGLSYYSLRKACIQLSKGVLGFSFADFIFIESRSDNCLALLFRHLVPLPTFAKPNQAKFLHILLMTAEMHTLDGWLLTWKTQQMWQKRQFRDKAGCNDRDGGRKRSQ